MSSNYATPLLIISYVLLTTFVIALVVTVVFLYKKGCEQDEKDEIGKQEVVERMISHGTPPKHMGPDTRGKPSPDTKRKGVVDGFEPEIKPEDDAEAHKKDTGKPLTDKPDPSLPGINPYEGTRSDQRESTFDDNVPPGNEDFQQSLLSD